jgi:Phasin protein
VRQVHGTPRGPKMQPSSMSSSRTPDVAKHDRHQIPLGGAAGGFYSAWCKSADIILRSLRVWNAALFGLAWMTTEDAFDAARARLSCTTLGSLADLERELAPRLLADAFARFCLLMTISTQIGEEASYPLQRRLIVELEKLAPLLCA